MWKGSISGNYWITSLYVLSLLIFLLAPFDFQIPFRFEKNGVNWLSETNGVEFLSSGAIFSSLSPDRLYKSLALDSDMTLEVWMATKSSQQTGPARIVSYSKNTTFQNFMLGQAPHEIVMRLQTGSDRDIAYLRVKDTFLSDRPYHIVVANNLYEANIYVNGQLRQNIPLLNADFSNWNPSHRLVLGNEATGNRPWLGQLFLVAIYDHALSQAEVNSNHAAGPEFDSAESASNSSRVNDGLLVLYLFTEEKGNTVLDQSGMSPPLDLQIPTNLFINNKTFLLSPYSEYIYLSPFQIIIEVIGNIIIFIPIGYLFYTTLGKRYRSSSKITSLALISSILLTCGIELMHYFVMSKNSSTTDIIHNTLGALLGIFLAKSSRYIGRFTAKYMIGSK